MSACAPSRVPRVTAVNAAAHLAPGTILAIPPNEERWKFFVSGCSCAGPGRNVFHGNLREAEECSTRVLRKASGVMQAVKPKQGE